MNRKELEAMGISAENIQKIMDMHQKATESKKTEIENLKTQLKEANDNLAEVNEKLKDVESKDETIADLKKQIADRVQADKDREEREKAEKADRELTDKIVAVFPEGTEFTSDYVRNGIIADIKKQMAEDSTKGAKEIFESLTKDKDGIFKNPQQQKLNIPGTHTQNGKDSVDAAEYLAKKYKNNVYFNGGN